MALLVRFKNDDVLQFVAVFFADINFSAWELIDDLIAPEKRHRIAGGEIEDGAAHFFLGRRRDLDVEPQGSGGAEKRDHHQRMANPGDAHSIGTKRDQFVVGREPPEDEQDGGEQTPRDGKDERERQDVGDETDQVFDRQIVIDEERQELPENIPDDENETEDNDREKEIHDELAADVAVDQFHRLPFVSSVPSAWQARLGWSHLVSVRTSGDWVNRYFSCASIQGGRLHRTARSASCKAIAQLGNRFSSHLPIRLTAPLPQFPFNGSVSGLSSSRCRLDCFLCSCSRAAGRLQRAGLRPVSWTVLASASWS